tara:strand:+ start:2327 stop:2764 length:438 start_codon:yes stop_codon:yes gene_type:complete
MVKMDTGSSEFLTDASKYLSIVLSSFAMGSVARFYYTYIKERDEREEYELGISNKLRESKEKTINWEKNCLENLAVDLAANNKTPEEEYGHIFNTTLIDEKFYPNKGDNYLELYFIMHPRERRRVLGRLEELTREYSEKESKRAG